MAADERAGGLRGRALLLPIIRFVGFLYSFSGLSLGVYLVQNKMKAIMKETNRRVHAVITNQYFATHILIP